MNQALCNRCERLVPAEAVERDGKMFLQKSCPECGQTETLISGDAVRYKSKHELDTGFDYQACHFNCTDCRHPRSWSLVFIDVTNRCNMNCPICLNNTPSMGYLFEPPKEYFEKIFKRLSQMDPRPHIQFFGGEPTVRADLIELINLARSYHLRVRVVTNGLKLANEDYCRELLNTRVRLFFAYDGENLKLYKDLRNSEKSLELKKKALENVRKYGRKGTVIMTLVSNEYNGPEMADLFQFCHDRRDFVNAIYLMPLAQTWSESEWDYAPPQMTAEDVEAHVQSVYQERIDFVPAAFLGNLGTLHRCLDVAPFPFAGAHPNCESAFILVSDGKQYVPITRLLKGAVPDVLNALQEMEKRLAQRVMKFESGLTSAVLAKMGLKKTALYLMGLQVIIQFMKRHVRLGDLFKGKGFAKLFHIAATFLKLALRIKRRKVLAQHTNVQGFLEVLVLPFESQHNIETDRMERCPTAFAFVDPRTDEVNFVPVCAWWSIHKSEMMPLIAERYSRVTKGADSVAVVAK